MSNIRVDLCVPVYDGKPVTFKSPVDCSTVTGLIVYYPEGETVTSKTFQFADAHGNNVGGKDLFAADVLVKVILDTEKSRAYVQNADTNAYLERELAKKYSPTNKPTPADIGASATGHKHTKSEITDFPSSMTPTAHNQAASTITAGTFAGQVVANGSGQTPGTSLLRNSRLVSADTNPTVEGEICWHYK